MTSSTSFFLLFLSPTLATLTLMAGVVELLEFSKSLESLLSLCCFFFLSFLVLVEGSESWVEVNTEALKAVKLSPQFIAP